MKEATKEKMKETLVELGLMDESDTIIEGLQANYFEYTLGKLGSWKQGWIYFTEEKIVYPTGLLSDNIVIPYKSIKEIGKCSQSMLPIGITVTYDTAEGKEKTTKFSMMKRDKWIDFLNEKRA